MTESEKFIEKEGFSPKIFKHSDQNDELNEFINFYMILRKK